jgi:hypothetical protein
MDAQTASGGPLHRTDSRHRPRAAQVYHLGLQSSLLRVAGDWRREVYCAFRERLRTILFVLPSQLPTTCWPSRSPRARMVKV